MNPFRLVSVSAAAFIVTAALMGCAAEPVEVPPKPAAPTPAPVETVEPAPQEDTQTEQPATPAATVLPASCEEILPADEVTKIHETLVPATGTDPAYHLQNLLGPKTWAALNGSETVLMCGWGINHSDAIAAVGIAVIDDATKTDLVAALRDSMYTASAMEGAELMFTQGQSSEHHWADEIVFDGDVLIASAHTISGDFADRAHRRVSELNPGLGDS